MTGTFSKLFGAHKNPLSSKHGFRPAFDTLEERQLMAGGLTASLGAGVLRIVGTEGADTITVRKQDNLIRVDGITAVFPAFAVPTASAGSNLFTPMNGPVGSGVTLNARFQGVVQAIEILGLGDNDTINLNSSSSVKSPLQTIVYEDITFPTVIFGGAGNDTIDGGAGPDAILGQAGADTINGRGGNDFIDGGADADVLHGNAGDDRLFGDAAADQLFGDQNNDTLFGGAGSDTLTDTSGSNTMSAGNDWYDDNLEDAGVRTLARLYHRDNSIDRREFLKIFEQVGEATGPADIVSGAEHRDLLDLVLRTDFINMPASVRNLATKTVVTDPANAHFQGATLGDLQAGFSGEHLGKLVDKWFLGLDRPATDGTVTYQRFVGNLIQDGVSVSDIEQGFLGDCYFIASLAGVARQQPAAIRDMFISNGDGTFTVRFFNPDRTADYVTVDRFLPAFDDGRPSNCHVGTVDGDNRTASDPDAELWGALAEKAYAQINESGRIDRIYPTDKGKNSYLALKDGNPEHAMEAILGRNADFSLMALSLPDVLNSPVAIVGSQSIRDSFDQGKVITLSTPAVGSIDPQLSHGHVYTMVGYEFDAANLVWKFKVVDPRATDEIITFSSWNEVKDNFFAWFSA